MAREGAVFGEGAVSTGIANLIGPVPVGQRWYVTRFDAANSASEDVVLTLYLRRGEATRLWKRAELDAGGGHCELVTDKAVILEAGDRIMGAATVEAAVAFYAAGIRET